MRRAPIALSPAIPWSLRLLDRLPLSLPAGGLVVGLAGFLPFLALTALAGHPGRLPAVAAPSEWVAELLLCLLIGLVPAVGVASVRGSLRDLDALRPFLDVPDPERFADLRRAITHYPRALIVLAGLSTLPGTAFFVLAASELWVGGRPPGPGSLDVWWMLARNGVNWWLIVRGIALELALARAFSGLGAHLAGIDLLDRRPLLVFARHGLRSVLLWMGIVALFSLLYAGPWAATSLGPSLASIAAFALAAFLLPVFGARRRLRALKEAELQRTRTAILEARARVMAANAEQRPEGGRLADLVAWERRVADAPEWPFDVPTLLRFALYLGLGLGSWVGAALVEHAVDVVLR